jgi:hypothetical protein
MDESPFKMGAPTSGSGVAVKDVPAFPPLTRKSPSLIGTRVVSRGFPLGATDAPIHGSEAPLERMGAGICGGRVGSEDEGLLGSEGPRPGREESPLAREGPSAIPLGPPIG